jgi:translation initiation factor IF-3
VRLIDENGVQIGIVPTHEALRLARERNLDLVEVAPNAVPPVCRIMDYGKYKYEQTKKEREARKHQKVVLLKEVRLTPTTDEHDLEVKARTILRFLEEGDKVKVTVRFRGREMAHPQLGKRALDAILAHLGGRAVVERPPMIEGRTMTMLLSPAPARASSTTAPAQPAQT